MSDSENKTPKQTWSQINEDLRGALDAWAVLGARENELSPEEQKLAEMRRLIADLKAQIRDFDDL